MSKKTDDLGLKIGSTNINNMGITALKYRNNAPNDKSFRVSILGINQKFTDDVPGDKRAELISRYNIPETVEAGADNYYTIKINGEFYVTIQNGNFKLYDQVMAYLPNGDWSRMYLDYPVNYTESVTLHVFTQAEEPEEGMNVNDVWLKLDENENIVALYHYGLNEDTQENEWIFDGKVESGGTGKFLDDAHTSVAHNDTINNTSEGMYDSVDGYDNQLTGTSTVSQTGYVSNGANTVSGQHNRLTNSTAMMSSGRRNTIGANSDSSVTTGVDNTFFKAVYSFASGNSFQSGIIWCSVALAENSSVLQSVMNSLVDLTGCYMLRIDRSVVVGENIKGSGNNAPAGDIEYSVVVTTNTAITNYIYGCSIFGRNHTIYSCYNDIVGGGGNELHSANNCAVVGYGNYVETDDCIVCGQYGTTVGNVDYYFVIGGGTSSSSRSNIFTVDTSGNVNAAGTITPGGADYAETYEWFDGNPDGEDRRGLFVTLDGKYIKLATSEDDYILGIISATPSICGDTYDLHWKGKYRKNIFGEIEYDDDGNPIISDDYNSELKYIPQSQRKEKAKVGTQGKLVVVDDGTCQVNKYCKPSVNGVGTYTDDKNYYRVLERLDNTHIKIVIK